jgi:hypothetical protein
LFYGMRRNLMEAASAAAIGQAPLTPVLKVATACSQIPCELKQFLFFGPFVVVA